MVRTAFSRRCCSTAPAMSMSMPATVHATKVHHWPDCDASGKKLMFFIKVMTLPSDICDSSGSGV